MGETLHTQIPATSFLEYSFLRWVLTPAVGDGVLPHVTAQREVLVGGHRYRLDYALESEHGHLAIELDGFQFHGDRDAFTYDRLRQNDLQAAGWRVVRFSYEAIRRETARCVAQLQAFLSMDPTLAEFLIPHPVVETPQMDPDPLWAFDASPGSPLVPDSYFAAHRGRLNLRTLRECQVEAFARLSDYYRRGGQYAACVMSVGAGKTALGVLACLAFAQRRALVVTPGSVIRGTFHRALDPQAVNNVLYGLPGGPLIPGCRPPVVRTLDREAGAIRGISRDELLSCDILVTNFHSLGTGEDPDDLLSKLGPDDIDFIVIDEAHIAAAESYQRTFRHFGRARSLLMSACFQRLDGRPIEADVVYRHRLIDAIADGNAKNLRIQRFAPDADQTVYEMVWPDGRREEIVGRDALLEAVQDERKLSRIVARSDASIRQVMRAVKEALDRQTQILFPIKPRVLFSALGERHAEQIARIAQEYGIPCTYLHHSMSEARIKAVRERFEHDSGDLQGIVQLKMLGQGYDFPPITVVAAMRPYGSFSEFYQFVGRGIRVLLHPALAGRVGPGEQFLDILYHSELGLDDHIETIYRENDMDPATGQALSTPANSVAAGEMPGSQGVTTAERPETFVLFEPGMIERRIVHDATRIEQRRQEREREVLAQRYAVYAQSTASPVTFEQFALIMRQFSE